MFLNHAAFSICHHLRRKRPVGKDQDTTTAEPHGGTGKSSNFSDKHIISAKFLEKFPDNPPSTNIQFQVILMTRTNECNSIAYNFPSRFPEYIFHCFCFAFPFLNPVLPCFSSYFIFLAVIHSIHFVRICFHFSSTWLGNFAHFRYRNTTDQAPLSSPSRSPSP